MSYRDGRHAATTTAEEARSNLIFIGWFAYALLGGRAIFWVLERSPDWADLPIAIGMTLLLIAAHRIVLGAAAALAIVIVLLSWITQHFT